MFRICHPDEPLREFTPHLSTKIENVFQGMTQLRYPQLLIRCSDHS
jgi:hypothetical protein